MCNIFIVLKKRKVIVSYDFETAEYIYIYVTLLVFLHALRCDKAFLFFYFYLTAYIQNFVFDFLGFFFLGVKVDDQTGVA